MYIVKRENTSNKTEQYFTQTTNNTMTVLSFTNSINQAHTFESIEQAENTIACALNNDTAQGIGKYNYTVSMNRTHK